MDAQSRAGTQPASLRGLKALVGGLGVLVILGTALVISVVIHRLYAKPSAPSMPAAVTAAPTEFPPLADRLPAGDTIKSIASAGADLAIWVSGPNGEQILLLNPATGQLTIAVSK